MYNHVMIEKENNKDKFNPENYLRPTIVIKKEMSTRPIAIVSAVDVQRVNEKIRTSTENNKKGRVELYPPCWSLPKF